MGNDLKRAFTEDGKRRTHIGGQALIEGVMMRGKLNWAVAVREPDGNIHSEEHPLSKKGKRAAWLSWPLVRGCVALVDSLVLGCKALEIAANHAFADEDEEAKDVAEEVVAGGLCVDGEFDGRACVVSEADQVCAGEALKVAGEPKKSEGDSVDGASAGSASDEDEGETLRMATVRPNLPRMLKAPRSPMPQMEMTSRSSARPKWQFPW